MKAWAKGQTASRIDPALAAAATALVDLAVMFGLHDQMGISQEELLTGLLHVAVILTMLRTVQLNVPGKSKALDLPDPVGHESGAVGVGAVDVEDGDADQAP